MTLLDSVMEQLSDSKVAVALLKIRRYFPITDERYDAFVKSAVSEIERLESNLGRAYNYEFLLEYPVGETAIKRIYIVKYPFDIIRWEFVLYKRPDKPQWIFKLIQWQQGILNLYDDIYSSDSKIRASAKSSY